MSKFPKINVAGVELQAVSFTAAVTELSELLASDRQSLLTTPNPEMIVAAQSDFEFRDILNSSALATPDGVGLIWASHFLALTRRNLWTLFTSLLRLICCQSSLRTQLPERVTGTDLFPEILKIAAKQDKSVFLLGATPGVAEIVAKRFEKEIPNLQIAGCHAGSPRVEDEAEIISRIQKSSAAVLIVAYGAPAQEKWLARNLQYLPNIKLAAGLGGAFDFHAGRIRRAPAAFRSLGLEWLWRLIRQPSRFHRIWTATVRFIKVVWQAK